jgi:hypothetical protein
VTFLFVITGVNLRGLSGETTVDWIEGGLNVRDAAVTDRLRKLVAKVTSLTKEGGLLWERQVGSAHRYARWNNNLLILGPDNPVSDTDVPRYLFITPFDSPSCIEINSVDEQLGQDVLDLVTAVESHTKNESPTDPFAMTDDFLTTLTD